MSADTPKKPMKPEEIILPEFRSDLELFEGPPEPDGSKTWSLYDPIRAQYFRVTWKEAMILRYIRPGMTMSTLMTILDKQTTLDVTKEDIQVFFEDAAKNLLLHTHRTSEVLNEEAKKYEGGFSPLSILKYLSFRFPLINPMHFMKKTAWLIRPLASRLALAFYLFISICGIVLVISRIDEFIHTFTYFFNLQGILAYMATIVVVKFAHEFAHAYTAYFYGVNVPTIGVAFIAFWPILFTDVTDSWRLPSRRDRLAITFSGVLVELVIAGLATFGWAISSPGIFQSLFFIVATTTWISSIMINLNPAMRFDGYYLLSDLWGVDNMQSRSFEITRWKLRQWFLGLEVSPPEEGLSQKRIRGMVCYSLFTWLYRILIYSFIIGVIYYSLTKALGLFLLAIALYNFIVQPIIQEVSVINKQKAQLKLNTRLITTCVASGILFIWFVFPFPHVNYFPAIARPISEQTIYIPHNSIVKEIYVKRGDTVQKGDPLIQLTWPPLDYGVVERRVEYELIEQDLYGFIEEKEDHSKIPERHGELDLVRAQLDGMLEQRNQNTLYSTISGKIYEWENDMWINQALPELEVIGHIAGYQGSQVVAFVAESHVSKIEVGMRATFQSNRSLEKYPGTIRSIHSVREEDLQHPQLASIYGGDIPVKKEGGGEEARLLFIESFYEITIELDEPQAIETIGEQGDLLVRAGWQSKLVLFMKYLASIFWKESGF